MKGFPPDPDARWTLEGWQFAPLNRWSFRHLREIVPTARVAHDPRGPGALPRSDRTYDPALAVPRVDGSVAGAGQVLADTFTDGFLALKGGAVVTEQYFAGMAPDTTHLLMSVSKSIVSCVCGILIDRGVLHLDAPVTAHVPEFSGAGYDGATIRDLLDMRSGICFSEDYLDPNAEVRQLEQVIGWAPRRVEGLPESMYEWLATLEAKGEHGGPFEYRSCETDVLGWVCERASGQRMPDLLSKLLWQRLRTEVDMDAGVDAAGAVLHDGGLATTLRDLGRFGQMLVDQGAVDGQQVVPAWWIDDSVRGGEDSRRAFADSPTDSRLPGGMYRNQFWVPYPDEDVLLCLGIHGQLVYADISSDFVAVKLSSWPYPQDASMFLDTLAMVRSLAASLA
jgi:CubicO group peptidase (beta-lactamase class C family)